MEFLALQWFQIENHSIIVEIMVILVTLVNLDTIKFGGEGGASIRDIMVLELVSFEVNNEFIPVMNMCFQRSAWFVYNTNLKGD